jgi:hypothetical protein
MCQSVFRLSLGNVGGVNLGGCSTACQTCQGRVVASRAVHVDRLRDGSSQGIFILGKECRGTSGVGHRGGFQLVGPSWNAFTSLPDCRCQRQVPFGAVGVGAT